LADKLDQLVGFFAIGEKPTGSSDPFALRRAALGTVRLILENAVRIHLPMLLVRQGRLVMADMIRMAKGSAHLDKNLFEQLRDDSPLKKALSKREKTIDVLIESTVEDVVPQEWEIKRSLEVLNFLSDRLKVVLKDKGIEHDRIDAIWALAIETDLVRLVARVEALQAFLKSDDGANLLAGYKRAANILKIEEKKDGPYGGEIDENLLTEPAEKALATALTKAQAASAPALEKEDFAAAMREMAALRSPVDVFFDKVKVNADDAAVRANRLNLLAALRATLHKVADFSKIEG
jgi:glycyl-tRNA synthetase beta chain